jgi:hypothetical protein
MRPKATVVADKDAAATTKARDYSTSNTTNDSSL